MDYANNTNATWYSGYETVAINPQETFTYSEYDIKQLMVAVSVSGLEMLQNAGEDRSIPLVASRIENAEKTMVNNLSADIYSDGTADGGRQVGGLKLLVADAGTGTVGGINSSTWSFWQNYFYSFASNSQTPGVATIQSAMNQTYLNLLRNKDKVDLFVADNTYFNYYWQSLQSIQRITSEKLGQAGFDNLKFMSSDVTPDGGLGGKITANHMFALNTEYIFYRPHRRRNMTPIDPDRYSTNQDAVIKLIGWAGNMTISNGFLQGVLF
jgi:hypothetical protein